MGRGEFFQAFLRTASKGRTGFVPRFGRGRPPSFSCDCENTRKGGLHQAVGAGAEEFEEAEVAEDLELLADFVGDGLVGLDQPSNGLGLQFYLIRDTL